MADKNVFTESLSHQQRVTAHWVINAVALILITIAQSAIYINKERNGYPHYQSLHSLFGIATYLTTLLATFNGTANKYSQKLKSFVKPVMIKIVHGFVGVFAYVLATVTILLGIYQSWNEEGDDNVKIGLVAVLSVSAFYVVNKSVKVALDRKKEMSKKVKK